MKILFNSSMPRSGSTLLQNILGNNPNIYTTPTSPLVDIILSSKKHYSSSVVVKAQNSQQMKSAFLTYCRFGLEGYFSGITNKKIVVDKSRSWSINYEFINSFYPNPKIVCMVRDLRDVVASMENNFRKHTDKWDYTFDTKKPRTTIHERVNHWFNTKPVGSTLKKLHDVFHRGYAKNMLFIKFESLCENPEKEMKKIYNFFELPYYAVDYNNIKQVTFEDDKFHGIYGDHKIKSKIEPLVSKANSLLGAQLCNRIYDLNRWYFETFKYEK
jgi:sulfotransferase